MAGQDDQPDPPFKPHNIEAEQALLGTLLIFNEVYDRVSLEVEDFYDPMHGKLYSLIGRMIQRGMTASPVTLKGAVNAMEGFEQLGGADYLARMAGAMISARAAPDYAKVIKDLAGRRRALEAMELAQSEILTFDKDLADVIAELEQNMQIEDATRATAFSFGQAADLAVERMNTAFHGKRPPGIDLRIPELTEKTGNVLPGDMLLLGARPSMGKSALSIEITRRCAKDGIPVVYWCGEMAPEDNAERMIAAELMERGVSLPYHNARRGRMSENQFKHLLEATREIERLPVKFIEPSIKRIDRLVSEIRRHVRKYKAHHEHVLVVADYVQIIDGTGKNRFEDVTQVSKALKGAAIDLRVPVIALSQLSRQVEARDDKRPKLADLRESGQLEQDGNTIVFVYRDEYYLERAVKSGDDMAVKSAAAVALEHCRGHMELIVAKQRSGPLETVVVKFNGATNSITSLDATENDAASQLVQEEMTV